MPKKVKAGIIGATGYTGVVLTRLLLDHPEVELSLLTSEQYAGKKYYEVYPAFYGLVKNKLQKPSPEKIAKTCDIVFCATPNGFSKEFLPKLLSKKHNLKVIDLSADFRLKTKVKVKNKNLQIAYGLPEIYRSKIKTSQIIANPGCYPTSAILALAPILKKNIIDLNSIIIDSKSGVSGAGRGIKQELHFTEVNDSFAPYKLARAHRHIPEIENELNKLANAKKKFTVVFSPHLIPINRGILTIIYAKLTKKGINQNKIFSLYKNYYEKEYFIKVLPSTIYPNTKNVRCTNFCQITPLIDKKNNTLIVVSAIDNMVKGASGQAIQNMNLILSLPEHLGLDGIAEVP